MNPYPFVGLNHFTVPVAISVSNVGRAQYRWRPSTTRTAIGPPNRGVHRIDTSPAVRAGLTSTVSVDANAVLGLEIRAGLSGRTSRTVCQQGSRSTVFCRRPARFYQEAGPLLRAKASCRRSRAESAP